jgi:mannitol-1-phosphate 5-dehydrogenase
VIACENMVGASQALRGFVMEHVPDESVQAVEEIPGIPNAAVDRIVPEYQEQGLGYGRAGRAFLRVGRRCLSGKG